MGKMCLHPPLSATTSWHCLREKHPLLNRSILHTVKRQNVGGHASQKLPIWQRPLPPILITRCSSRLQIKMGLLIYLYSFKVTQAASKLFYEKNNERILSLVYTPSLVFGFSSAAAISCCSVEL